jgi:hypothetical protein
MLVLVLNALMPLVAQAVLASVGPGDTVEVCTSTGVVRVPIDKDNDSGKSDATRMRSCPFCLLHDSQTWLPPSSVSVPIPRDYAEMPPAFYQAAVTSAVWLIALSRGPPLILS